MLHEFKPLPIQEEFISQSQLIRLFMHIRGAFAEYEAGLIRGRTLAGLATARRQGKRLGRPRALDKNQLARAKRMASSGRSIRYIAGILRVSPATAHRAIQERR